MNKNKEIIVKVWSEKNKTMSEGMTLTMLAGYLGAKYPNLTDEIFLQDTGMIDLLKNKVYNGDVITFRCPHCVHEHRAEVIWFGELAGWGLKDEIQEVPFSQLQMNDEGEPEAMALLKIERVLGNVYQNPELMSNKFKK